MAELENKNKSSLGIASLPLGIVSIVFCWLFIISIPTGILAIIFGIKGIKKIGSKLGKAGLITGIVGLSLTLLSIILLVITILIQIL